MSFILTSTPDIGPTCGSIFIDAIIKGIEARCNASIEEVEDIKVLNRVELINTITFYILNNINPTGARDIQKWQDSNPDNLFQKNQDLYFSVLTMRGRLAMCKLEEDQIDARGESWKRKQPNSLLTLTANARFNGSILAMKEELQRQAIRYMVSYPGSSSEFTNTSAHSTITKAIKHPRALDDPEWEWLYTLLHYRTWSMAAAEKLIQRMGIRASAAKHVDLQSWRKSNPGLSKDRQKWYPLIRKCRFFPRFPGVADTYTKPMHYMAAACVLCGLPDDELRRRFRLAQRGEHPVFGYLPILHELIRDVINSSGRGDSSRVR